MCNSSFIRMISLANRSSAAFPARDRRLLAAALLLPVLGLALPAAAVTVNATFNQPSIDRWFYPFASAPGTETSARLFGSTDDPKFSSAFDNRDGQMYLTYNTGAQITPGLAPGEYQIVSARITLMNSQDLNFVYDNTVDPYGVFLPKNDPHSVPDADPGQPIELFGAGYRNGFTAATFPETGPYSPSGPFGKHIRNVYPITHDSAGKTFDVADSVDDHLTPQPWAIGTISGLTPGALVPLNSTIVLDINVSDPDIQGYLQQALAGGIAPFCVTALTKVAIMAGAFPTIYTKENQFVIMGQASAAKLEITVQVGAPVFGDFNGDGHVNGVDLALLLGVWTGSASYTPCPPFLPQDLNQDCKVNGLDLGMLLGAWTG